MTMAAWTDTEYARGTFSASTYNTEASVNGGASYAQAPVGSPATMTFNGTGMSPNTVRYATLFVRTTSGTTVAGTGNLLSATFSGTGAGTTASFLQGNLRYRAISFTGVATCGSALFTAAAAGSYLVGSSSTSASMTTAPATTTFSLPAAGAAPPAQICFEVSMVSNAPSEIQGQTLDVTWPFTSLSVQ